MPRKRPTQLDLMVIEYQKHPNDEIVSEILFKIDRLIDIVTKKYYSSSLMDWYDMKIMLQVAVWKRAIPNYKIKKSSFFGLAKLTMESEGKNVLKHFSRAKRIPRHLVVPLTEIWTEEGLIRQKPDYNNWFINLLKKEEISELIEWCKKNLTGLEMDAFTTSLGERSSILNRQFKDSNSYWQSLSRAKKKIRNEYGKENFYFHIFDQNAIIHQFALEVQC